MVVTDNQRRILFADRAAERMFRASTIIASRSGKLQGACAAVETGLQKAFKHLKREQRQIIRLTPQAANKSDCLTATLLRLDSGRLALVLTDSSAARTDFRPMLQQCYQMTASEADVVQTILSGESLRDHCDCHKATYETARSHLKNAMKKNGWRRQGEMITEVLLSLLPGESSG